MTSFDLFCFDWNQSNGHQSHANPHADRQPRTHHQPVNSSRVSFSKSDDNRSVCLISPPPSLFMQMEAITLNPTIIANEAIKCSIFSMSFTWIPCGVDSLPSISGAEINVRDTRQRTGRLSRIYIFSFLSCKNIMLRGHYALLSLWLVETYTYTCWFFK